MATYQMRTREEVLGGEPRKAEHGSGSDVKFRGGRGGQGGGLNLANLAKLSFREEMIDSADRENEPDCWY